MDYFERVKELARANNTTIEAVANSAKLSRDSYNSYRKKGNLPRADEACEMAEFLGTTVEYLVSGKVLSSWYPSRIADIVEDLKIIDDDQALDPIRTLAHTAAERVRARGNAPPTAARVSGE